MTDKAVIKQTDMTDDMQKDAITLSIYAIEKYNTEQEIASYVRNEFNKKYNPTWHCIVGGNFATFVTHEMKTFIYFYLGQTAVVLFKCG